MLVSTTAKRCFVLLAIASLMTVSMPADLAQAQLRQPEVNRFSGDGQEMVIDTMASGNQTSAPGVTPDGLSATEWSNILQQIAEGAYRAQPAGDGTYAATNRSHGWQITYGADGATQVRPNTNAAHWHWSLTLASYGYAEPITVQRPSALVADEQQLTYRWSADLAEWWKNGTTGLEQGFTIQRRPLGARAGQKLRVQMRVGGALAAIQQDGAIHFVDAAGATAFTYDKLAAWDATGRLLPAKMALDDNRLTIEVNDSGAIFPLTIDPILQQAYVKPSFIGAANLFGYAVAVSGDTAVVGAPGENVDSGAAYVFVRSNGQWSQDARLQTSNAGAGDRFGEAVAIDGTTIVVGAPGESSNGSSPTDNSMQGAGAAYVFVRTSAWVQAAYLKASNPDSGDGFGQSVAIQAGVIAVGAPYESSASPNPADNSAPGAGAAYAFQGSGSSWTQTGYLKANNAGSGDNFGWSVATSQQRIAVGAPLEDSNSMNINGNPFNEAAQDAGAAYIFQNAGSWFQTTYVKATNTSAGSRFGWSVAMSDASAAGATLVAGAPYEDGGAPDAGSAYVYWGSNWGQQAYLKASNPGQGDQFGTSVALYGDWVVAGAPYEDGAGTGTTANPFNEGAPDAGAAYVFGRFVSAQGVLSWSQQAYVKASNTDAGDNFGSAVAVYGSWTDPGGIRMVAGAPLEDSGVNGNPNDNSMQNAGASYMFGWYLLYTIPAGTGSGAITVSPSGFLQGPGTAVSVSAAANTGSTFAGWSGDCSGTAACELTMNSSKVVTATFNLNQYNVEVSADPNAGGAVTGGGIVNHGATITVTASANIGYTFVNWTENGVPVSASAAYSFVAVGNRLLVANFSLNQYTVDASASPAAGGSVAGGGAVSHGDTITLTATANTGYTFVNWTENGAPVSTEPTYSFQAMSGRTLVANFSLDQYTFGVSTEPAAGGSATVPPPASHGETVTVTATANTGYTFVNWTESDAPVSTSAVYAFAATGSRTLVANFALKQYSVTVSANPAEGGNATGGGTVSHGSTVTVTAAAGIGYTFVNWAENNMPVATNAAYAFTATGDRTLVANFAPARHQIFTGTAGAGSGLITLDPAGGAYDFGTVVTATATADPGATFAGWSGDCAGSGACVLTVDGDKSITATFGLTSEPLPAIVVAKRANVATAVVGETAIVYSYVVTNTGEVTLTVQAADDRLGSIALAVEPAGAPALSVTLAPGATAAGTQITVAQTSDLPGPLHNSVVATGTAVTDDLLVTATDDVTVDLLLRGQAGTMCYGDAVTLGVNAPPAAQPVYDLVVIDTPAPANLFLAGVTGCAPYTGARSLVGLTNALLLQSDPTGNAVTPVTRIIFAPDGTSLTETVAAVSSIIELFFPAISNVCGGTGACR